MSLASMAGVVPGASAALPELTINLAEVGGFTPETGKEDQYILRWRKPSIAQMYAAGDVSQKLQRKHPMWSAELLHDVAVLSLCHISPKPEDGKSVASLYEDLIEGPEANDRLWWYLLMRFASEWPEVARMELVAEVVRRNPEVAEKLKGFGMSADALKKRPSPDSASGGFTGTQPNLTTSPAKPSRRSRR